MLAKSGASGNGTVVGDTYVFGYSFGTVTAYDIPSGAVRWRRPSPETENYQQFAVTPGPVVVNGHLLSIRDGSDLYAGQRNEGPCCLVDNTVVALKYSLSPNIHIEVTGYAAGTSRRLWQAAVDYGTGWAMDGGVM